MKLVSQFFGFNKTQHERTIKAQKNALAMLFTKGASIVISLLYVPLLINSLEPINYGIWLTIISIVGWFNLLDIGLGNGLRNNLAKTLAADDFQKAKIYISTAYAAVTVFSFVLSGLFLLISSKVSWSLVLNAPESMDNDLRYLVNFVFVLFFVQFIFRILYSILQGLQLPSIASLIQLFGQLLSFIFVFVSVKYWGRSSLVDLGIIISISPILVLLTFTFFLFSKKLKAFRPSLKEVNLNFLKDIFGLGLKFFVLQIITIIVFQTSNIIILHNVGPEGVAEFNIAHKYIGLISMVFTIIITPIWSATTDAFHKGDLGWIKKTVRELNYLMVGLSFFGLVLFSFSRFFYNIWLGDAIYPNFAILGFTLLFFVLLMHYANYNYVLNGMGKINLQLLVTSVTAAIYLPLAFFASKYYGIVGLLTAMCLVVFINAIWARIQYKKIIAGKAIGIWNK